jgi:hypothetical protein
MIPEDRSPKGRNYFVDEGGDDTLFSARGNVLIETPGCSRFFILGLLDVADPASLGKALSQLRGQLMADPYFSKVPSMQSKQRKTAIAFHAKDDLPEIRREVFTLLRKSIGLRFFAIVTDKKRVLEYVRQRNHQDPSYRYKQNELYDFLVRRLFKNLLHKDASYEIIFSKRGKSDRTLALKTALETTRKRFCDAKGIYINAPIHVSAGNPPDHPGLQAVDYFIWSLQRLFELGEERYVDFLRPSFKLVIDIDNTQIAGYGVYYDKSNPITAEAIVQRNKKPGI